MSARDPKDFAKLQEIAADPGNLALRLQFAEWLKGRGHKYLPELIHLQCEETRLRLTGTPRNLKMAEVLGMDVEELMLKHGEKILRYFGIEWDFSMLDEIDLQPEMDDDYPVITLQFKDGLPTSACLKSGNLDVLPEVLRKLLLLDVYTFNNDDDEKHPSLYAAPWSELAKITGLQSLTFDCCFDFKDIPVFESLTSLQFGGTISGLDHYGLIPTQPKLQELCITGRGPTTPTLAGMHAFPELVHLELPPATRSLQGMPDLPKLKSLRMCVKDFRLLDALKDHPAFEHLHLHWDSTVGTLSGIESFSDRLRTLKSDARVCDISALAGFSKLERLEIPEVALERRQLQHIPASIKQLHLRSGNQDKPATLLPAAKEMLKQGHWPQLEVLNGEEVPGRKKRRKKTAEPAEGAPAAEKEVSSFAEVLEHLKVVGERAKAFKRPTELSRISRSR